MSFGEQIVGADGDDAFGCGCAGDGLECVVEVGVGCRAAGDDACAGAHVAGRAEFLDEKIGDAGVVVPASAFGEVRGAEHGGAAEDGERDAVLPGEAEVCEHGGEACLQVELGWSAGVHGGARVEHDVQREVFFFEEELDEELAEAGVRVPIDEARIVAGGVAAEVVEFG